MSWTLELFSPRATPITLPEMEARLQHIAPGVALRSDADLGEATTTAATVTLHDVASDAARPLAYIQVQKFAIEKENDPQLLETLQNEIAISDEEDGDLDEEYSARLHQILQDTHWHYVIWAVGSKRPERERLVVQTAYALSQIGGGVIHDLQSGAWMDTTLFESLLPAYAATDLVE
jgi:hypothetical protein